jgi:hypothetical protein
LGDAFSGFRPGGSQFILINQNGKYSPDNTASPFAGLMRPQLGIKMTAVHSTETFNLFTGTIDSWALSPNLKSPRNCTLSARDNGKLLKNVNITTSLFANYNVGSLFHEVLTEAAVNSFQIDQIADVSPFTWFRDYNAKNAIDDLALSGFSYTFVDGGGVFNVKRRYYEITGSVVASLNESYDMRYGLSDDAVFNLINAEGEPREPDTVTQTLAFIPSAFFIPSSSHIAFSLEYLDPSNNEPAPGLDMITPINSLDYKANEFLDGSGVDKTSVASVSTKFFGQSAVNTVFNGSDSGIFLTSLNLRGKPVHRRPRFTTTAQDSSSQSLYETKEIRMFSAYFENQTFTQDYSDYLLERNKDPNKDMSISIRNEFPLVLSTELSDQFHLVNSFLGVNENEIITAISHTIDLQNGLVHQVNYTLDAFRDQAVLILDDPVFGELDARRLGF